MDLAIAIIFIAGVFIVSFLLRRSRAGKRVNKSKTRDWNETRHDEHVVDEDGSNNDDRDD